MVGVKSIGVRTKRNHIIVMAIAEGKREEQIIKDEMMKTARELKKHTGGKISFEIYINSPNNNLPEG